MKKFYIKRTDSVIIEESFFQTKMKKYWIENFYEVIMLYFLHDYDNIEAKL